LSMIAMILAAGRGERMRPLTDYRPKPLLLAGDKSLIVWHIERLVEAGITDIVINHAYLGAQIEQALGDGSRYHAHIQYSPENPVLETAGGIANALPLLRPQHLQSETAPFAVINGDIYCDYDFALLPVRAAALAASGDVAHLVLVDNPPHHANGDFCLDAGRVGPRGTGATGGCALTFSGIGVYQPAMFAHIPHGTAAPLAPLLHAHIAQNRISGEHHGGRWMDVGTPERLNELDNLLRASQGDRHD
jgi:MurNAc alpha-1-phosphate uridylyltransferase